MNRCKCGRRMSKYANQCDRCHRARMDELQAEARRVVATGACPDCGGKLKSNHSILGWFQCEQYGADDRRARPSEPSCNFQAFTQ
ncbi:MAG: hypothetical protein GY769_17590 [bacterium]|nr:hypothetical protein [bacterium]